MEFDKVLRKQRKSYKRFMLSMGFIFLLLPIILYLSKTFNIFFIIYLCILELLILLAIIARFNDDYLKFSVNGDKISISVLMGRVKYKLNSEKVVAVHAIPQEKYFDIMIITTSTFRNKRIRMLTDKTITRYEGLDNLYHKIKLPGNRNYYYLIIRRGGVKKHFLLHTLFRSCLAATFSENAIENIKEFIKENKAGKR